MPPVGIRDTMKDVVAADITIRDNEVRTAVIISTVRRAKGGFFSWHKCYPVGIVGIQMVAFDEAI